MEKQVVRPSGALIAVATLVAPLMLAALSLASPSYAAPETCTDGVTVVVDPSGLTGDDATSACVEADGDAGIAEDYVEAAGHEHAFAQQVPGMVCRVDGEPADHPCVRAPSADAYWGLFWSDGTSAEWSSADFGITELEIPAGGSVGWAWQDGGEPDPPTLPPEQAGQSGQAGQSDPSADGTDASAGADEASAAEDPDGLPTWLVVVVLAAIALALLVLVLRRRTQHQE